MITTLIIFTNLFTPLISEIKINPSQSITATYDPKFDMMYLTIDDFVDVKNIIESSNVACISEKKLLEKEYSVQLAQSQLSCLDRIEFLTNSLDTYKSQNKLLIKNNGLLEKNSKIWKWIAIIGSIGAGVGGFYLAY